MYFIKMLISNVFTIRVNIIKKKLWYWNKSENEMDFSIAQILWYNHNDYYNYNSPKFTHQLPGIGIHSYKPTAPRSGEYYSTALWFTRFASMFKQTVNIYCELDDGCVCCMVFGFINNHGAGVTHNIILIYERQCGSQRHIEYLNVSN